MCFFFKFQENDLIMEYEMDGSWCMHAGEEKYIRSFVWENVKEVDGLDTLVHNGSRQFGHPGSQWKLILK
jgi:hypothetical protein